MIEANTLLLGSIVANKNGFQFEVVGIFKDQILCDFEGNEGDVFEFKPSEVFGVPLTEEWLVNRFGFTKELLDFTDDEINDPETPDIYVQYRCNLDKRITIDYDTLSGYSFGISMPMGGLGGETDFGSLKYVHQLMNLVLDLKGTELKANH